MDVPWYTVKIFSKIINNTSCSCQMKHKPETGLLCYSVWVCDTRADLNSTFYIINCIYKNLTLLGCRNWQMDCPHTDGISWSQPEINTFITSGISRCQVQSRPKYFPYKLWLLKKFQNQLQIFPSVDSCHHGMVRPLNCGWGLQICRLAANILNKLS